MYERFKFNRSLRSALACLILLSTSSAFTATIRDDEFKRAKAALQVAEENSATFVTNEKPDLKDVELFKTLKDDPKIWNVLIERFYKDKKGKEKFDQRMLYPSRTSIRRLEVDPREENNASYAYAIDGNSLSIPMVVVTKRVNVVDQPGGQIRILLITDNNETIKRAIEKEKKHAQSQK